MKLKAVRDVAQRVAIAGGLACLACGTATKFFHTSRIAAGLFWLFLVLALAAALISLPRRKSAAALALLALAYVWSDGGASYGYRTTFASPDGKHRLVIYSRPMLVAFPGQGSDAPGYVRLQEQSGRVLEEGYVEMVHMAFEVEWHADEVDVGRIYTWKLPR